MTIVLVGGGSGGHITPLIALAKNLKKKHSGVKIVVITEKGSKFSHILEGHSEIDKIYTIYAGKLRRYHGESWLARVFDVKTIFFNIRDLFKITAGLLQSLVLVPRLKPNMIFVKGGFVGVPAGLAARFWRVSYITHDSDAVPGLANKLIGSGAKLHAVGMPKEFYNYPKDKTVFTGVPISEEIGLVDEKLQKQKKKSVGLDENNELLLVTGGSNGATRIDAGVHKIAKKLLENNPKLSIIHQVGKGNSKLYADYPEELKSRIRVETFLKPLTDYSAAAGLIITRAGATTIAEFARQQKPCILIPSPFLAGGHQLKNAEAIEKSQAALVVSEDIILNNPDLFYEKTQELLKDAKLQKSLAKNLHDLIPTDATDKIADLILKQAEANK